VPPAPRRRPSPAARLGLAALWIALAPALAHAATFTVTKTADTDGICQATDCSLREAIKAANNAGASNVINFAPALIGGNTISLTGSLPLDITKVLVIDGTTTANLTVEGDNTNALFQFTAGRNDRGGCHPAARAARGGRRHSPEARRQRGPDPE
jgi:CSLREA domain-containing protein